MKIFLLVAFLLAGISIQGFSQSINEIEIKKTPQGGGIPLCPSSCDECGKLIFTTYIASLKFISPMGNIKEQKVIGAVTPNGFEKFTYYVVTKALPTQQITITGPSVIDYDLTVEELEPATCQDFFINFKANLKPDDDPKPDVGSFFLKTNPSGATFSIFGEPQTNELTPFLIKNHVLGTFKVRLEKSDYNSVDTSITFLSNEIAELNVNLKPKIDTKKVLQAAIKKQSKKQNFWMISTVITAGAGGYFMYASNQKYNEYLKATGSNASQLRETYELYDKLGPALLGVAGVCALEFTIQTIKKGKSKEKLKLYTNGKGVALSYKF